MISLVATPHMHMHTHAETWQCKQCVLHLTASSANSEAYPTARLHIHTYSREIRLSFHLCNWIQYQWRWKINRISAATKAPWMKLPSKCLCTYVCVYRLWRKWLRLLTHLRTRIYISMYMFELQCDYFSVLVCQFTTATSKYGVRNARITGKRAIEYFFLVIYENFARLPMWLNILYI